MYKETFKIKEMVKGIKHVKTSKDPFENIMKVSDYKKPTNKVVDESVINKFEKKVNPKV